MSMVSVSAAAANLGSIVYFQDDLAGDAGTALNLSSPEIDASGLGWFPRVGGTVSDMLLDGAGRAYPGVTNGRYGFDPAVHDYTVECMVNGPTVDGRILYIRSNLRTVALGTTNSRRIQVGFAVASTSTVSIAYYEVNTIVASVSKSITIDTSAMVKVIAVGATVDLYINDILELSLTYEEDATASLCNDAGIKGTVADAAYNFESVVCYSN